MSNEDSSEIMGMTGFQSPCEEYAEKRLSLDQRYITSPASTLIFKAANNSKFFNIHSGDKLIVDRALTPKHGDTVLVVINNEHHVKKINKEPNGIFLLPNRIPLKGDEFSNDCIEGVVTTIIKELRK